MSSFIKLTTPTPMSKSESSSGVSMSVAIPIREVRIYRCSLAVRVAYATDTRSEFAMLVVELMSDGITGWGEVLMPRIEPLWGWAQRVAPRLVGQDAAALDALIDRWPADRPTLGMKECSTYCHPDVDCVAEAVSIALHDLTAQARGLRFADLLGPVRRTLIPGMPVVALRPPNAMAAEAATWVRDGLRYVKIKFSADPLVDIERIRAVRAAVGNAISLQVDANGGYPTWTSAESLLDVLNETRVDVIEDLYDVGAVDLYRQAREKLDGRYMVDKDAHWPHVQKILRLRAADIINQHPHNQGRMSLAMAIARVTHAAGLENAVGSSGILGIQNMAYLHLAAVTGLTRPCEDIGMHNYHVRFPAIQSVSFDRIPTVLTNPIYLEKGMLQLPDKPGLGVTIDRTLLKNVTVEEKTFRG